MFSPRSCNSSRTLPFSRQNRREAYLLPVSRLRIRVSPCNLVRRCHTSQECRTHHTLRLQHLPGQAEGLSLARHPAREASSHPDFRALRRKCNCRWPPGVSPACNPVVRVRIRRNNSRQASCSRCGTRQRRSQGAAVWAEAALVPLRPHQVRKPVVRNPSSCPLNEDGAYCHFPPPHLTFSNGQ